ncbi:MAG: hypothetical protein V4655_07540 [Bdellovibrionota bacterium]|nr:MAG: hypothetical protein EOP10_26575 [Pseudomonadota bacterium]
MIKHTLCAILLVTQGFAYGAESNIQAMDSVLDRLERKLMEQEASTLKIEPIRDTPKAQQNVRLPKGSIEGRQPGFDDFAALEKQIGSLEKEADELTGQIEASKAELLDKSSKGSLVEINALIEDPDLTSIRELSLSIDGKKIYAMDGGDWTPSPEIPFFIGPLAAGEHQIELSARTIRRREKSLPLDQNITHRYDQIFKINVASGAFHKGYRLRLVRPEQQNTRAQASMEIYDIP